MVDYLEDKHCIARPHSYAGKFNWRHKLFVDNNPYQRPEDKNKADQWIESCLTQGLKYLSRLFSADDHWKKFKLLIA